MSTPHITIVHGIGTHGGGVDQMGRRLAEKGYPVRFYEYQKRRFYSYWRRSSMIRDGRSLAHFAHDGDHIIAHSNGALLWQSAIEAGQQWDKCFIFGGAARSDPARFPEQAFNEAHIYYNPEDKALLAGSWLPFHPFGRLGRIGYAGPMDRRITNHPVLHQEWFDLEHSHYFNPPFQDDIIDDVIEKLGPPWN